MVMRGRAIELFSQAYGNLLSWKIPVTRSTVVPTFSSRLTSRWGLCKVDASGAYSIVINGRLQSADERSFLRTVYHELLHTCPGCMNHGPHWKAYAAQVNAHTGLDISRCTTSDEQGVVIARRVLVPRYTCDSCGGEYRIPAARKMGFPESYYDGECYCPKCHGQHFTKRRSD